MTDWTARIEALPPFPDVHFISGMYDSGYLHLMTALTNGALQARLSLAAERMREPHTGACVRYMDKCDRVELSIVCTCDKDDDLRRILEGK